MKREILRLTNNFDEKMQIQFVIYLSFLRWYFPTFAPSHLFFFSSTPANTMLLLCVRCVVVDVSAVNSYNNIGIFFQIILLIDDSLFDSFQLILSYWQIYCISVLNDMWMPSSTALELSPQKVQRSYDFHHYLSCLWLCRGIFLNEWNLISKGQMWMSGAYLFFFIFLNSSDSIRE